MRAWTSATKAAFEPMALGLLRLGAVSAASAVWFALVAPWQAQANTYCTVILDTERLVASSVGNTVALRTQWLPTADGLARALPDDGAAETHRDLVFALRIGSMDGARTAFRGMREAIPTCFGLETPPPETEVRAPDAPPGEAAGEESSDDGGGISRQRDVPKIAITLGSYLALLIAIGVISFAMTLLSRRSMWRRAPRYACAIPSTVKAPKSNAEGVMININEFGAQIERSELEIKEGDAIDVRTPIFKATADVMWTNQTYMGVRFQKPIETKTVALAIRFKKEAEPEASDARPEAT